jgi:hypothetical protein
MPVAQGDKGEITGPDARIIDHVQELLTRPSSAGVHQERPFREDDVIPGRAQIPAPSVGISRRKPKDHSSGGQGCLYDHVIARAISMPKYLYSVIGAHLFPLVSGFLFDF